MSKGMMNNSSDIDQSDKLYERKIDMGINCTGSNFAMTLNGEDDSPKETKRIVSNLFNSDSLKSGIYDGINIQINNA